MNIVSFPGLNLEFTLNRIAFNIFGVKIYWYAILIFLSIVIGLFLAKRKNGMYNISFDNIIEVITITIPVSIIFARLYYVLFNLDSYKFNLLDILNIRNGGIAIYGAILGGVISIICYCKIEKINYLDLLDYIIPYVVLGQCIGRWGNFVNVEAYGSEYNGMFRMGIIENGNYREVHPTFLYESIVTFILFIVLIRLQKKRKYSGEVLVMYLGIYSVFRGIIEEFRVDSLMLGNIRVSQLLSILICICSISVNIIIVFKKYIMKGKLNYEKH